MRTKNENEWKKMCKIKETENNHVICIRRALELVKSLLIQKKETTHESDIISTEKYELY